MPALYAHDRFGEKVSEKSDGELKNIIFKYYNQYEVGLQGPDILFFYRPYHGNDVAKYGSHLHAVSALPFFEHAAKVVNYYGRDSAQYAYLLGFICHYTLDSECHPYVSEMMEKEHVSHLAIESEFEKYLLKKDKQHPLAYRLDRLITADRETALAIAPFYENISPKTVKESLQWLKLVKRFLRAPGALKRGFLNLLFTVVPGFGFCKDLMHQKQDNSNCTESNYGLYKRFRRAEDVAVRLMESFDESLKYGQDLEQRFNRTFE